MMIKRIIFATGNEGKMREVRMIMEDLGVEVLSLKEAGVAVDVEENGTTFEENAVIKATFTAYGDIEGDLDRVPIRIYYPTA